MDRFAPPRRRSMVKSPWIALTSRILLTVALVAGLAIAVYLVRHHESQTYGDASVTLANCPQTETVNCEVVNTSAWSELFHVPIAAYAVPTYATLLALLWAGHRRPAFLAYAFGIGLLTTAYSLFLLWVSASRIGFVCLWCMRLYAVNIAVPVLAALAAMRSPRALAAEVLRDLRMRPATLRLAMGVFVGLLIVTIGAQQAYRAELRRDAAAARSKIEKEGGPLLPAVPESETQGNTRGEASRVVLPREAASGVRLAAIVPPMIAAAAPPAAPAPQSGAPQAIYQLAGPLRKVTADKREVKGAAFDLQGRLGKGKPIALIFWAPGYRPSENTLVEFAKIFAKDAPQFEVYAVAGRRDDQRDEEIVEEFSMLDLPKDLPLLIDDKFVVSEALSVSDVPNVALFSAKGALVVAKMKALDQYLVSANGNVLASDVLHRVAAGEEVPQIKQMHPAYPSAELMGKTAPSFSLKKLGSEGLYTFNAKRESGRPAMVMIWSATCKHCQLEIPQMVKWVNAHPGMVDIVGVTQLKKDKPGKMSHRDITKAYVKDQGISWTIVEDSDGAVSELYESISTPTTYFVSPSGKITAIWYYAHEEGFDQAMTTELAKAKAASND